MTLAAPRELQMSDESAFCENVTTYTDRIPCIEGTVNYNFEQDRATDMSIQSRPNASRPGYLSVKRGEFEFQTWAIGQNSDIGAGTLSATFHMDLLKWWLGASTVTDDGGTISSATDGDTFVTTGVTALTPGNAIRVGVKGDARADGQMGVIDTWSGGNTQLLNALPGTPSASDVVRPCHVAYWSQGAALTSKRFLLGLTGSGNQWHAHGCGCTGVTFDFPIETGAPPRTTFRGRSSWWQRASVTIPSASPTMANCNTSNISGGSFHLSATGTTTRTLLKPSSIQLTVDFGLASLPGAAAAAQPDQLYHAHERLFAIPKLRIVIPKDDHTWDTAFSTDGSGSTFYQAAFNTQGYTASGGGRMFGFYLPRMYQVGMRPTFTAGPGGIMYQTLDFIGTEGTDTTSELTRSAVRFFAG